MSLTSPYLWVLLVMFAAGIILHYPQQLLRIESESLFSVVGLAHYAVERILFLIPITFAGMYFGVRTGLLSMAIALAIILPRVFMTSEYRTEAVMETGTVVILGLLINLWFGTRRKENELYRQLITRLEESEQEMSMSEQKYRYLFENASDAIWVQDVNGLFVDGNRAFETLTGFTIDELKGVQLARFLSPESLNLARDVRGKLIREEEFEQPYEQQFYIKDGSMMSVKMSTNPVMSGGRISGFEHVARDITEEKRQQENILSYARQITRTQEEERKRIARDLHDDVSPLLLVLIQKLDNLASGQRPKVAALKESIQGLRGQAVEALESLRSCAQGLRPRIIDDLGLVAAIEWIGDVLERDRGIATNVEVTNIERAISPETQIVLFRIAQEALNNIRKHAQASRVEIKVEAMDNDIVMTITDNGKGFEVPERAEDMVSAGRLGLMGMYERARLLNGDLQILSEPGKGTKLVVRLPWLTTD